ncbi:hypothetical protein LCGC14_2295610, partial [marine sediment metagenome]
MCRKLAIVGLWLLLPWSAAGVHSATLASEKATLPGLNLGTATSRPAILGQTGADAREMLFRMLGYVVVILVLGGIGLVVVKKVLPRIAPRAGKRIVVLETVYLGPRKSLHLLEVGSRRFLIAGSR